MMEQQIPPAADPLRKYIASYFFPAGEGARRTDPGTFMVVYYELIMMGEKYVITQRYGTEDGRPHTQTRMALSTVQNDDEVKKIQTFANSNFYYHWMVGATRTSLEHVFTLFFEYLLDKLYDIPTVHCTNDKRGGGWKMTTKSLLYNTHNNT